MSSAHLPRTTSLGLLALAGTAGAFEVSPQFANCVGNVIAASATSCAWAQRFADEGQAAGNPLAVGSRPAAQFTPLTAEAPCANLTQDEVLLELLNFAGNASNASVDDLSRLMAGRFDLPVINTQAAMHDFFGKNTPANETSALTHENTTASDNTTVFHLNATASPDESFEAESEAIDSTLEKLKALLPHAANETVNLTEADLQKIETHFKDLFAQLHRLSRSNNCSIHTAAPSSHGDTPDSSLFTAGGVTARYFAELYGALVATQAVGVAHGVIDGFGSGIKTLVGMKNVPKDPAFFRSQQIHLSWGWGAQAGVRKGFAVAGGQDTISTYLKAFETSPTGQVALTFLVGLGVQALPYLWHGVTNQPINLEPVPSPWALLKVPQMVWERCFAALESEMHTGPAPLPKAALQAALDVALDEMKAHGVGTEYIAIVGALFTFLIHCDRIYQFIKYKKQAEAKNIDGVMPNDAKRLALTTMQTFLFSSMNVHALVSMGATPPGVEDAPLQSTEAQLLVGGLLVGGVGGRALAAVLKAAAHRLIDKVPEDKRPANFHPDKLDATIDMLAAAQAGVGGQYLGGPWAGLFARLLASLPAQELATHLRDCLREMCASPEVAAPTSPRAPRRDSMEMSPLTADARRSSMPGVAEERRGSEPDLKQPAPADLTFDSLRPRSPHVTSEGTR